MLKDISYGDVVIAFEWANKASIRQKSFNKNGSMTN
jgi:hypothetical protein